MPLEELVIEIPDSLKGKRLDQALATLFPDHSRARLQGWIKAGYIRLGDAIPRQRDILRGGETLHVNIEEQAPVVSDKKQDIPVDFIHVDEDIIILNKPPGLVVHPGAGNRDYTLLNALLFHYPELEHLPRAGIVQRLDKDTSGLMVVARSARAHTSLVDQLQGRTMGREYQAIVNGVMTAGGTVDAPVGRHPVKRKRMAVDERGKPAVTHYTVVKRFNAHTHVRLRLESGRTHQIRVHMAHIRHPVVGDPVYGGRQKLPREAGSELISMLQEFPRQALHACLLRLTHPATGEELSWEAALPKDMAQLLDSLARNGH